MKDQKKEWVLRIWVMGMVGWLCGPLMVASPFSCGVVLGLCTVLLSILLEDEAV